MSALAELRWVLTVLERASGPAPEPVSRDPFTLILWEQVAYLAPEDRRRAAFERLRHEVGLTPADILAAPVERLRAIARDGGSIAADERADRMRVSATLVRERWDGELGRALALPLSKARRALTAFPMIGPPGADRILAITGAHAVLGLDSNALRVCTRLGWGDEQQAYASTYRSVMTAIAAQLPPTSGELASVSALLKRHGETICRRSNPKCQVCPLAAQCAWAANTGARPAPDRHE